VNKRREPGDSSIMRSFIIVSFTKCYREDKMAGTCGILGIND
jgi:hypothetical protein